MIKLKYWKKNGDRELVQKVRKEKRNGTGITLRVGLDNVAQDEHVFYVSRLISLSRLSCTLFRITIVINWPWLRTSVGKRSPDRHIYMQIITSFWPSGVIATRFKSSLLKPGITILSSLRHSYNHNRHFSFRIPQSPLFNMDPKLASIIEQVKVDIITPTQQRDNARQLEEVSRSFICELE